ncbi:MAG: hypothetical protein R3E10_16070 [Gemmatimonadota bacterium]
MTERRYDDDEVRAIFERASTPVPAGEGRGTLPSKGTGFSLAELQEIGAEAGIEPARVAEAALSLDRRPGRAVGPVRRGPIPLRVGHSVHLPGPFSEDDWNRLVVDLRDTFDAKGRLSVEGAFREWRNGNLYAAVEPDGDGVRLRMGTRKESAQAALMMGTMMAVMGAVLFLLYATGIKDGAIRGAFVLEVFGMVGLGAGLIQLPGWAGTRAQQMEGIAERALLRAATRGAGTTEE